MINYPDSIRVYDDFLSEENAYKIYASMSSLPQQWFSLMRGTIDEKNEPKNSKTWWNIHGDKSKAPDYDPAGRSTYQYLVTNEHQSGCNCVYCDMTNLFTYNQPPEAQGLAVLKPSLTLMRPGDYQSQNLNPAENKVWAFSYCLSVGWRPEWGGVLHAQDPDDGEWYAFPPVFNRLIMWDVTPGNTAINTYVSEVVPSCPVNRVTYDGVWGVDIGAPAELGPDMSAGVAEAEPGVWDDSDPAFEDNRVHVSMENPNFEVHETSVMPPEDTPFDPEADFKFEGEFEITMDDDDTELDES